MRNPLQGKRSRATGEVWQGKSFAYVFRGLMRYLGKERALLFAAIILTMLSSVLSITGTSLAADAIGAISGESEHPVYVYLVFMVVFYVLSAVISYLLSVMMVKISQRMVHRMRTDIYDRLISLPVSFFDTKQAGELVSVISYDVNTVNETLSSDFIQIISSLATVIYSLVLMVTVSPILMLVFVVTLPLAIIAISLISKLVRPLYRRRSAALGEMNGYVEEMIAGHRTIKTYGAEADVISRFAPKNRAAADAYAAAEKVGTLPAPTVLFINNLTLALVNMFGAVLYMSGGVFALDIAGLSRFVLLSRRFSGPINQIATIYADIQSALAAAERVFRLIDEEPEPEDAPGAGALSVTRGVVEFNSVRFGYTPEREIIRGLSFRAPEGSVTAIVGPTGAGKTTIINLLMRFYDIDGGSITIDGEDIYSVRRDSLRRAYTMVLQDTWLFHGTIYDNVAYGKEGVTREDVERVCRDARIHSYIISLPDGYDTVLSEAQNISKGQKQLLTIARAMLIDSPMLILDEATSNVDSKTERDISDAMVRLMEGKTCFVIAHRLSTIVGADKILVVKDGDVIESGTHKELLSKGGFYSELYYSQFDNIETREEIKV